ncbi:hypothetical protein [Sphingomonas sp. 28-63-12]|uniref:hypothetical protein n=1 Tax=Sphingomonas sp. 28-63-12 TaxID=1970434 RepID=UPI000BDA21AA|nr:MAG: hypothetical protein B7Y47_03980 [Sphingomonas sp. 28-63-12]
MCNDGIRVAVAARASVAAGRLAGIAFWLVYLPATAIVCAITTAAWRAVGIPPLLILPLDFAWAGPLSIMLAPIVGAMAYDLGF